MRYDWLMLFASATGPFTSIATVSASRWDNMRVKHTWGATPAHWENLGPPLAGTTFDLRIALKPHRKNALVDALYARPVSTTHGGGWLTVTGISVSQANDLLGASYQLYRHAATRDTILRTIGYALPVALHAHVRTVAPTTYFGLLRTAQKMPLMRPGGASAAPVEEPVATLSSRDGIIVTPPYLRWLYKTVSYVPSATDRNVLGVAGYLGQYPSPADLGLFMGKYRFDATGDATFTVVQINGGGNDPGNPGTEANLNIQYTQGMAYPTPHIFYSTGGLPPFIPDSSQSTNDNEPFLDWLEYVLSQPNIRVPRTISTSYGESEQSVPLDYAINVCDLFAQLGARGVSVIFSSGNNGVGAGDCIVNDGSGKVQFLPTFPASCPWVTSVGGTTDDGPEVAASFSGGGFSNYFDLPSYQHNAVSTFLRNLGDKYAGLYNASSRGYPDIAAQAQHFATSFEGKFRIVAGTSCSAPVVAGIISLLNDFLLSHNKAPLGFLNPRLYGAGLEGLNDITSGSNPGCNTDGFSAVVGWDPVTGLGTPDFVKLQEIVTRTTLSTSVHATPNSATPSTSPALAAPPNITPSSPWQRQHTGYKN